MTGMPADATSALTTQVKNKIILVTGASSGIGRELCLLLAANGAQLIITGRALPRLESLEKNLSKASEAIGGPTPVLLPMNFEGVNGEDLETVRNAIEEQFGKLDGLVHCAATPGTHAPLESYRADLWMRVSHVNAQFPMLLTQALMPALHKAEQPLVAFALDPNADQGQPYWGAYGTSKAALRCFAEQLNAELENSKFNILGVSLPATLTPGRRQAFPSQNESDLAKASDSAATLHNEIAKAWH